MLNDISEMSGLTISRTKWYVNDIENQKIKIFENKKATRLTESVDTNKQEGQKRPRLWTENKY